MQKKMGERLKTARKESRLSLIALANLLGVGDSTVLRWEKGTPIPATALPIIAKATNRPIEYFLYEDHQLSESRVKSTAEVSAVLGAEIEAKNKEIDTLKAYVKKLEHYALPLMELEKLGQEAADRKDDEQAG